jgi:hypothetical protein
MRERMVQKIESVRQAPEHIRLRYTLGAVSFCMIFIVGIWFLTLKESINGLSPAAKQKGGELQEVLSEVKKSTPAAPSLSDLKENNQPVTIDGNKPSADDFIENEITKQTTTRNLIPTEPSN